jgi:hypothetical protein
VLRWRQDHRSRFLDRWEMRNPGLRDPSASMASKVLVIGMAASGLNQLEAVEASKIRNRPPTVLDEGERNLGGQGKRRVVHATIAGVPGERHPF